MDDSKIKTVVPVPNPAADQEKSGQPTAAKMPSSEHARLQRKSIESLTKLKRVAWPYCPHFQDTLNIAMHQTDNK